MMILNYSNMYKQVEDPILFRSNFRKQLDKIIDDEKKSTNLEIGIFNYSLKEANQLALQYVSNYGEVASTYPSNPNGSPEGLAGVCSESGRVTIMMPHPERVYRTVQNSWHPSDWAEDAPWLRIFRNARNWFL